MCSHREKKIVIRGLFISSSHANMRNEQKRTSLVCTAARSHQECITNSKFIVHSCKIHRLHSNHTDAENRTRISVEKSISMCFFFFLHFPCVGQQLIDNRLERSFFISFVDYFPSSHSSRQKNNKFWFSTIFFCPVETRRNFHHLHFSSTRKFMNFSLAIFLLTMVEMSGRNKMNICLTFFIRFLSFANVFVAEKW